MKCASCGHDNLPGDEICDNCAASITDSPSPSLQHGLSEKISGSVVGDLKPRKAITIDSSAQISEAAQLMRKHKMGCVLAIKDGKVVGIMTERDLLLGVAGIQDPDKAIVQEIMHADPICLKEDDPVSFAFHHMTVGGYRHLPIIHNDHSVGMISSRDLLAYLSA